MKFLNTLKIRLSLLAGLGALTLIAPAYGDGPRALANHFGPHRNSCYQRVYDEAHLKAHPQQRVAMIRFENFPDVYGPVGEDGKVYFDEKTGEVTFSIIVAFRDHPHKLYSNDGACYPEGGKLRCGIDCDGGSFTLSDAGKTDIMLHNEGFRVTVCEGDDEATAWVDPEPDDKDFKLTRLPDSDCTPPPELEDNTVSQ